MSLHEAARRYVEMGWQLVPVPYRSKGPKLSDWQRLRMTQGDIARMLPLPSNVGVILGAVSRGLVDIDLDCDEAIELAPLILPTTWTYGRASKPRSHWLYVVSGGLDFRKYIDRLGDKPQTMVELRSSRDEGRLQSVLPPSVHECGEAIEWTQDADGEEAPTEVDGRVLCALVERLAIASLYARHGHVEDTVEWVAARGPVPRVSVTLLRETERLRGVVPQREVAARIGKARNVEKRTTLDEAVRAYNEAHAYDWPRGGGTCPMCQHRGCFGVLPSAPSRWACFSSAHPDGLGVAGAQCHHGDALDVDAHRARLSRVGLLRQEGYL